MTIMRSIALLASCLTALASVCTAELNLTQQLSSKQILPTNFKPPQVFKNVNLVRTTNLDKEYPREVINVIIENIDKKPQSKYYLPFESSLIARVGGLEVKDKKAAGKQPFKVEVVEFDSYWYAGH
jgi:oligosaccharyltransferase complex subunit alpha (ribophorin I)